MSIHEKQKAIHGPLYGCENEGCREEQTFWPEDLAWYDAGNTTDETYGYEIEWDAGWYCNNCAGDIKEKISPRGISLADFLESQS